MAHKYLNSIFACQDLHVNETNPDGRFEESARTSSTRIK
jgi:hypothetical protein